jgi:hypothetical protein
MLTSLNPYELNLQADIEVRTVDKSTGEDVPTWVVQNPNVWMKRLAPPRGTENTEAMQRVAVQRDSFLIREEGRTITAANHRINQNGELFYITGVRPYKSSLDMKVLDTEKRDN